ncbi:hypothetical protein HPB52_004234 [Rhipicephalus sanguineus]|uniref:Protein transport protein Sec61 subunit gamma n=1 Tax=Rhipicephalus sanguineus TaxID=34632 RepID=A0A9D4STV8_RHISA|nr:hypothetical protein HPB52_004234 [Rhipicephalus sanguineus]
MLLARGPFSPHEHPCPAGASTPANTAVPARQQHRIYLTPAERTHPKEAMDQVMAFIDPFKQLSKDSIRLIKRCTKPDRKEFQKIAMATAIGFAIMGFIGFFVKLIHIPINNIIV